MKVKLTNPALDKGKDSRRAVRGGSWGSDTWGTEVSDRNYDFPSSRSSGLGFRLVKNKD
jgi:formylglycine-generating enzyme required for sulfatase activity